MENYILSFPYKFNQLKLESKNDLLMLNKMKWLKLEMLHFSNDYFFQISPNSIVFSDRTKSGQID